MWAWNKSVPKWGGFQSMGCKDVGIAACRDAVEGCYAWCFGGKGTSFGIAVSLLLPSQGLERTQRENFGGGNTAWEEEKLAKYANR